MWVLSFLPDWIFYAIGLLGVAGLCASYLMKFIPFVYVYKTPIQIISILCIVIGAFMGGASYNEQIWAKRVQEVEKKVAVAEVKSKEENVKVTTKVVTKMQLVRERGQDIVKYVDREVVKYDSTCIIPKEFVEAHNKAADKP